MFKAIFFICILSNLTTLYAGSLPSKCFGTPKNGHLENGWQLPKSGKNFEAYSSIGVMAGRNFVHDKVYKVIVDSYKELELTAPNKFFIYGETGFKEGGAFKPHKTHRNGLSVDFFVPVLNKNGLSAKLPISLLNKLGYNIEFDSKAQYEDYKIDFDAIAQHLLALKKESDKQGIGIKVVIFDNDYQKLLFTTEVGRSLPSLIKFSTKKPWVRHDEHYHIDFDVNCQT